MGKDRYVAYVGTYTRKNSVGIHVYDIDLEKGALKERSIAPISNPSNVVVANSGKYLYSIEDDGVASFTIDENGDLTKMNQSSIGGMRGCYLSIDSKDRYLFLAGYHDGRVTMMRLNSDGTIAGIAAGIFHSGIGKSSVEKRLEPRVAQVALTPDEKYACAVDWGLNQVKIYDVDYESGDLTLNDIVRCPFNTNPRRIRFTLNGKFAYILLESTNQIEIYSYKDTDKGPEFEKIDTFDLKSQDDHLASSSGLEFSPDGKYLFASLDGVNEVICLQVNDETGELTQESVAKVSGDYPKVIRMLPDNKTIVSLNHDTNEIRTFNVDHEKKCMLMKNAPISIDKPNSIRIHKLS